MEQMRALITGFPDQMKEAWHIAEQTPLDWNGWTPSSALILGMGGSGISGAIASKMLAGSSSAFIQANSDYTIPAWVGKETLVLVCSYSGNTEETLMALDAAMAKNARIAAIRLMRPWRKTHALRPSRPGENWGSDAMQTAGHRCAFQGDNHPGRSLDTPSPRSCTYCTP